MLKRLKDSTHFTVLFFSVRLIVCGVTKKLQILMCKNKSTLKENLIN